MGAGHGQHPAVVIRIEPVFHETGFGGQHFIAGVEEGLQDHVQRPGGAAGHDDFIASDGRSLLAGEVVGDGDAHLGIAGLGHVAMVAQTA